jgi:hypothetical protein
MINLMNDSIANYGPAPVIATAFLVGLVAKPIIGKIIALSIEFFKFMAAWANEWAPTVQIRSVGCDQCAETHRRHIAAAPLR